MNIGTCEKQCRGRNKADEALPRIWLLLADARRARIYRKDEKGDIRLVDQIRNTGPEASYQGRPPVDDFVRDIAGWLGDFAEGDAFDRFVLVGAAQMLPRIREGLADTVQARMMAQIDEDLAYLDEQELRDKISHMMCL